MNRYVRTLVRAFMLLLCMPLFASCSGGNGSQYEPEKTPYQPLTDFEDTISGVQADLTKFMNVSLVDEGVDIYAYDYGMTWGYRYGPTMMNYADGSMDAWFAAPGAGGPWDFFTYRHSDDGTNWSNEKVVLQPLADTMDYPSVCDPGSVYFNGYYYLGYTSTIYAEGICNNGFVARSKYPDGPYEKWNGSGWGGEPAPIIYYTGDKTGWGAGEMSFVEVDGTLYIYYTWKTPNENTTRVSIADATDENWPATIQYKGVAMTYDVGANEDSADVKYVEDYGKFIAINTTRRMGPDSALQIWESNDGFTFYRTNELRTNVIYYCHNAGFMSRPNGHINLNDTLYLGYAYGGTSNEWGKWSTRLHAFRITLGDEIDTSDAEKENRKVDVEPWTHDEMWTIGITTKNNQHYEKRISDGPFPIEILYFYTTFEQDVVKDGDLVHFYDYDDSIITFDGLTCIPKKTGETYVTAEYDGCIHTFKISILPDDAFIAEQTPKIVAFYSALRYPCDGPVKVAADGSITLSNQNRKDRVQLRAMAEFEDGNWMELFNDQKDKVQYSTDYYKITYESADENVVRVDARGVVTVRGVGSTSVTVSCAGFSYVVPITVV